MTHRTFSFEFFPPKDEAGEDRLWEALSRLTRHSPDYVSVTYGAGGTTRERTIRITSEITKRSSIPTVAHLTCVGSTREELIEILDRYHQAGIQSILALRGDPAGGPGAPWERTPGGFDHSDQLVQLAAERGDFTIGVAAFPDGHPASGGDLLQDVRVLLRKEELGASYATTQFFFNAQKWVDLVKRLKSAGSSIPVIPGILPVTSIKQLVRMAELSGTIIPEVISQKFMRVGTDPEAVKAVGVEIATELCRSLLDAGAPGLHFYTMNTSSATQEIFSNLRLSK